MPAASSRSSLSRIALLGCGPVGKAFASALLAGRGRPRYSGSVVLWSRTPRSASGAQKRLRELGVAKRRSRIATDLTEAVDGAQVILLCVADGAAEATLAALVGEPPGRRRKASSGKNPLLLVASGAQELAPLRARFGARFSIGRLHPLTPVPKRASADTFHGDPFGIEGPEAARRVARRLLRFWEGQPLELLGAGGGASAYHAGAALLGGGLVALYSLAEEVMAPSVRSRRELARALARFGRRNVENAASMGPAQALTGPLSRGSEALVRAHLEALGRVREASEAYRLLGATMLALAKARGSIDGGTERRLRRRLAEPRRKG